MSYLQKEGLDPVIVGSVAVIKHLKASSKEDVARSYRNTEDLDLFISKQLPKTPKGWRQDSDSIGVISWISPSGGYVDFLIAGHRFPDSSKNPDSIGKDPESDKMGCPLADVVSLFRMKLNSFREKDLLDLLNLARRTGIPKDLTKHYPLNETQKDNLSLLELWLTHEKK